MRASELVQKLQEMIEDYHVDPTIHIEISIEHRSHDEVRVNHEPVLDVEFRRGYFGFDKVILMKTKRHPKRELF